MASLLDKKIICVLEDDTDIREVVELLLESENYKVFSFGTVESFMREARGMNPNAYLLDVMLPDGNGMEVCEILKSSAETSTIPVVMMSANYSTESVFLHCKAQDFIKKPFDIMDFLGRVNAQVNLNQ